jgi:NCS1 family nucleobase:cation symporter-1
VGVAPTLPGFIAAVNLSVSLPAGMTELYFLNYLYGFLSSAVVYALLHRIFPARDVDDFVKNAPSAKEVQRHYTDRWEVDLSQAGHILSEDDSSGITHLDVNTKHEPTAVF